MDRKKFIKGLLGTITSFALMDSLIASNAINPKIRPLTEHWAILIHEYCSDLKKDAIDPVEWQSLIHELYQKIDLTELVQFIDFDRLLKGFEYPDLGVSTKMVRFPKLTGLPERTSYVKKVFGMQRDRAIIPHGHSNMSSAHLILKGEMHLRNYDKIAQDKERMIIRPTVDKIIYPGDSSSISDDKDNIHWFIANSETAFTFDVIVLDLNEQPYDIHNLDMYAKEEHGDGTLGVPILDVETALQKYGKETHH